MVMIPNTLPTATPATPTPAATRPRTFCVPIPPPWLPTVGGSGGGSLLDDAGVGGGPRGVGGGAGTGDGPGPGASGVGAGPPSTIPSRRSFSPSLITNVCVTGALPGTANVYVCSPGSTESAAP